MRFNPGNRREMEFEPIPIGKYRVQITDARLETSKSSGKDMIALEVTIVDSDHAGRKMFDYLVAGDWFDTKAGQILESVGIPLSGDLDVTPELLYQQVGSVKVKHEPYNGETRSKIAYWVAQVPAMARKLHPAVDALAGISNDPVNRNAGRVAAGVVPTEDAIPF